MATSVPHSLLWPGHGYVECPEENASGLLGRLQLPPGARLSARDAAAEQGWHRPESQRSLELGLGPLRSRRWLGARTPRRSGCDLRRAVSTDNQFKVQRGQRPPRTSYGRLGEWVGQTALGGGSWTLGESAVEIRDRRGGGNGEGGRGFEGGPCRSGSREAGGQSSAQREAGLHRASSYEDNLRHRAANKLKQQHRCAQMPWKSPKGCGRWTAPLPCPCPSLQV